MAKARIVLVWLVLVAAPVLGSGKRYWIDESTDFTGNGCETDV